MTAIAGYVDEAKVIWMGGDCAGVGGYSLSTLTRPKVFVKEQMIFGYCGSFRMADILQYHLDVPMRGIGQDVEDYLCRGVIEQIRTLMKTYGFLKNNAGRDEGGEFLIGHEGRIFKVQSDFSVLYRSSRYDATGCGEDLSLGAMHALLEHPSPPSGEAMVEAALKAAEAHSAGVRGPFKILSLDPQKKQDTQASSDAVPDATAQSPSA